MNDSADKPAQNPKDFSRPPAKNRERPAFGGTPANPATVVDEWFRSNFPGSPVARNTPAWNHLIAALDDLKSRLAATE